MLRAAIKKVGVYFYCLPTFRQAKLVIWDSITNDGRRFLDFIPKELIASMNSQEMKIKLVNGSMIQLIGSDTYDTSLVGTNPRMIVFSEFALSDVRAYQYSRPILTANNGVAILLSCVAPNTLVIGKNGLKRIKDVSAARTTYSDFSDVIWGLSGFNQAEQFYYGGLQQTVRIILKSGYEIECTQIHPIWNGKEWIKAKDLVVGDLIPVQYGQDVWGQGLDVSAFKLNCNAKRKFRFDYSQLNTDFFYLLGLIHADGNYNKNTVCVTKKKDPEIIKFLVDNGFRTRPDGIHHELSSRELVEFLEFLEFKHGARNKIFPEKLLECTKTQMIAFFQGLFDGDGTSNSNVKKRGKIKLTSTNESFLKTVQVVLLNFGIASSIRSEYKLPTERVKVASLIYNLEVCGHFAYLFYRDIGFRLQRKQKNKVHISPELALGSGNAYPIDHARLVNYPHDFSRLQGCQRRTLMRLNEKDPSSYLFELLAEKFYYSPIKEIITSSNEVFDFVIPQTHSFFSNGFISHNTPRGRSSFYEMFEIAKNSPDWFAQKLTIDDTLHIDKEEIQKEIDSGEMSWDLVQQEYYTSWEMGVEGSYYARYLDDMKLKGQIGTVAWESAFKVHTAWDLGVRDSTCIVWFQVIGQTVRIIDCYEKTKEGLEHYVKVIESKPYSYGKHFAPHDIAVKEFGSGLTRIEKAKQLGISFIVAPSLSIEDGIESVRSAFSKIWIDEKQCTALIKALENYRQEYDTKKRVYSTRPLHNWASNYSDAFRYLCISLPKTADGVSKEDLDQRYRQAMGQTDKAGGFFDFNNQGY